MQEEKNCCTCRTNFPTDGKEIIFLAFRKERNGVQRPWIYSFKKVVLHIFQTFCAKPGGFFWRINGIRDYSRPSSFLHMRSSLCVLCSGMSTHEFSLALKWQKICLSQKWGGYFPLKKLKSFFVGMFYGRAACVRQIAMACHAVSFPPHPTGVPVPPSEEAKEGNQKKHKKGQAQVSCDKKNPKVIAPYLSQKTSSNFNEITL